MARYQFRQDDWSYGMSSDTLGGRGSVYYADGVNLFDDKSKIKLSTRTSYYHSNTTAYFDEITSGVVTSNTEQAHWGDTGYCYDFSLSEIYKIQASGTSGRPKNSGLVTQEDGIKYGFVLGESKVHRWLYAYGQNTTGVVAPSGAIADNNFDNPGSWTVTGGWAISGGTANNLTGSAGSVSQTTTSSSGTTYRIKIQRDSNLVGTFTVKMGGVTLGTFTSSDSDTIKNFYRVGAGNNEVFQIDSAAGATGSFSYAISYYSNVQEDYLSFTPTGSDSGLRPYLISGNDVYFGAGSDVKRISAVSSGWSVTSTSLAIARDQSVVAITRIGDQFYVYASDGAAGYQYIWDGASSAADRVIKWYDLPISNAANVGNFDYVVCKDSTGKSYLYKVNGYSKQLIRQSGYVDSPSYGRFMFEAGYTNAIESIGETLLLPANASENTTSGIYTYGKKHAGYPESIAKSFSGFTGDVTSIYQGKDGGYYLYVVTRSGNTKRLYAIYKPLSSVNYASSGYVELSPIVGQFGEAQLKEAVKYRIGYNLPSSGCTVSVYYRKDAETSYTLHKTISTASTAYGSETFNLGVNFNKIQFKIVLATDSSTYSPEVFDFTLEYEPVNNSLGK